MYEITPLSLLTQQKIYKIYDGLSLVLEHNFWTILLPSLLGGCPEGTCILILHHPCYPDRRICLEVWGTGILFLNSCRHGANTDEALKIKLVTDISLNIEHWKFKVYISYSSLIELSSELMSWGGQDTYLGKSSQEILLLLTLISSWIWMSFAWVTLINTLSYPHPHVSGTFNYPHHLCSLFR